MDTEIDWKAYMQQVFQYISGERDYVKLYGDTGPLVYPAAHVYIYRLLHYLTDEGRDIYLAQYIFVGLYLATLALVMQCYRQAKVPPYIFPLLILSKRLHSIFLLRLFNDGFAAFFLFLAIFCYQRKLWTMGSLAYSFGLGVKMSLLLALPAVGIVLWQGMGRDRALRQAMLMGQVQILLGYPFLAASPRSYLARAFEFTRQFLFKWTVNWRFVGEETFLSRPFSVALLSAHAALLASFLAARWLNPAQSRPLQALQQLINPPPQAVQAKTASRVTPDFVLTSILTAMLIGCLCARSLHYQFFAYIAWSTPFLLWRSGLHPVLIYVVWAAQEWAWNVYPSTKTSSAVVVGCLAVTVAGSWLGTGDDAAVKSDTMEHQHAD
ncbi:dolichyl-P-Man:Man(5)GlcNAc(2)-PP-dolichol alpha-1,3-mannosyltransferase [Meristemomyces frigidus]|nr:dolichyl-P-Man:Man(5)GlcNAc(2)-PP-dolichol alpha-1,3-mannosyltransferase [Meristemomyces frigidus]